MSRGGTYVVWSLGGAALAVVVLVVTRPAIPLLAQAGIVVVAGLLTVPFVRYAEWRRRRDNELGERFGNGVLERLRKRRDGSSYRPEGRERVELDPGSGPTGDGETRA